MILKIKQFVVFITIMLSVACHQDKEVLVKIEGSQFHISDSLVPSAGIDSIIAPYSRHVNKILDSVLSYAPYRISKEDGKYNTTAGNLLADIILQEANPIFRSRAQRDIDFVVLNHGGIRSIISRGDVTARSAYEFMPFENHISVVELSGKSVRELVAYLINSERAHPISGIQIILGRDNSLQSVNIHGIPFDENKTYNVATSDYLVQGGDNMRFFGNTLKVVETDYLIRNAMIDYFKKTDTLKPVVDDRFINLK